MNEKPNWLCLSYSYHHNRSIRSIILIDDHMSLHSGKFYQQWTGDDQSRLVTYLRERLGMCQLHNESMFH